ncbi:YfhO family protein [Enterococcus sp. LJL99]
MKISNWIKQKGYGLLLSSILPMLIMIVVYFWLGIYPGSEKTVLASDNLSQGAPFLASFNNALHGKQSFFYSWYGSLGLNYWSLMAYYLNSFFSFFVYFFDNSQIPDVIYMIIILKFGAIGATFWVMSDQLFKIPQFAKILLSISFALNGFAIAYSPQYMWLDGLIYLPLVFLGIHRILAKKSSSVLFISYLLLFLSNFYLAFMIGVFSFLYFSCCFFTNPKQYKTCWKPYVLSSFLAGGASMITILPTVLDLRDNGESLTVISTILKRDMKVWDLPVKTMVGTYDTSQFGSSPFFYFGLLGLIFCLFYFVTLKIPRRSKLLFGSLFILLIASVYLEPLNLFWHGFHAPNMFLFRFSFLFSFFGLLLAGFALEKFEQEDLNTLMNIVLSLIVLYVVTVILVDRKRYDYLDRLSLILTIVLLFIYLGIGFSRKKWPRYSNLWTVLCVFFALGELGVNAHFTVVGINQEWGYPLRKHYDSNYEHIHQLVSQTKMDNSTLYRMANLDSVSRNESFVHGYSGVTMFSSIRNRHSSAYLNNLGFRSKQTNLTIQYENNTLLMDALLGIKYNLSKSDVNKYGYVKKETIGDYNLYENQFALPLGVTTDKGIYKEGAVLNQTELLHYLSETTTPFFYFSEVETIKTKDVEVAEKEQQVFYSPASPNKLAKVTYAIKVPARSQAYLSLYSEGLGTDITFKVNGIEHTTNLNSTGQYYDLGYYEEATTVEAEISMGGNRVVTMTKPNAMFLAIDHFEEAVHELQKKAIEFETTGRTAEAQVKLAEDQVIWTTIPYDKGWSAYIDGKKVEIPTFKDAFLTLSVPKGDHTIRFVFLPQGFKLGAGLFVSCITVHIVYYWQERKKYESIKGECNQ